MGKHCFNSGALDRSLEWFEEAWYLAGKEGNETLRQDQVHTFLDHAAKKVKRKDMSYKARIKQYSLNDQIM